MELSENAMRAEIQKLGVAPIDGTVPLSSCVEQLLSAFEGMRSQVAASRSKWDEMMGALSEVSEQTQTMKKQVEAQSMKKQVEAQSLKKQVEAQSMKKQVEAQSMKKQVEAQSLKKQVEAQSMKKQVEAQSLKKQAEEAVKDSDQQDSVKEAEVSEGYSHVKEMQEMIVEALEQ